MSEEQMINELMASIDDETVEALASIERRLRDAARSFNRGYERGYADGLSSEDLKDAYAAGFIAALCHRFDDEDVTS
jgi:hypothetical protein